MKTRVSNQGFPQCHSLNSYYFRATSIALLCLVRVRPCCYCADMRL